MVRWRLDPQEGKGLTFRSDEVQRILDMPNNFTGDYLTLRAEGPREPRTEFPARSTGAARHALVADR